MNILIAGGSGFIGTELINNFSQKHKITVLGRKLEKLEQSFSKDIHKLTWQNLIDHDATYYDLVINLAGASIGTKRWSAAVKKELIESRTLTNQHLIEWLVKYNARPRFFCANAVGIYGAQETSAEPFSEDSPLPLSSNDFLQQIGLTWEQSLKAAISADIPVTTLRFGVVLKQGEGMLKKLELPFRLGLGSILGSGQQVLSWVHYMDLVNALHFIIAHPNITGPINITAPFPIAQQEFAKTFAKALKRPLFFRTPAWFIIALLGEMGEYLLLKGQQVVPKRLTELGFSFSYPNIQAALAQEYQSTHKR